MQAPLCVYILAGGQSRRFGRDKARAMIHGRALLMRVKQMMGCVGQEVYCVGGQAQRYDDLGIETIADYENPKVIDGIQAVGEDQHGGLGPLGGIAGGLAHHLKTRGKGWCWFVSCDLGVIKKHWLNELLAKIDTSALASDVKRGALAVAYRDAFWEPFPGLYHTDLLSDIGQNLIANKRSVQRLLKGVHTIAVDKPGDWPSCNQINTPEDLKAFEDYLAANESA